ncbi:IPT/TIG domain-containing protein, partial [Promineifilum sp.]|uniref:IPT/TIG domain-containing protein n=1 Tax=Promineifilum sp. TaxID=2664178 RepID=UPI0035AE9A9B
NLVTGDTNGMLDIFFRDRQTGQTTRVSVSSSGAQGNGDSSKPAVSSDGRYVAFYSVASNLVAGDANDKRDVFVYDRQTAQTTLVSTSSAGVQGNADAYTCNISADGRYVAFYSGANNLVDNDTNNTGDVFIRDRQTAQTTLVSLNSDGVQGNSSSNTCHMSSDGRYVAFHSWSSNLVDNDTNDTGDVFVRDRETGQTTRVSISTSGEQGDDDSSFPSISDDGRYVAFWSGANSLIPQDSNGWDDVFVHDRETGQTTLISINTAGESGNGSSYAPAITADGRYVAFESYATDLVAGDTTTSLDMFVRDRETGQTKRVSVNSAGAQGNGFSYKAAISDDGRYVAFASGAANLVVNDTNEADDILLYDRDGVVGAPTVTGFSPLSGPVGTNVTITGTNLAEATAVTFNGTSQPSFTVNPAGTQVTAAVPAGATTGKIAVTTPGGTATSASDFTVILAPTISGFSPTSGPVGTSVTITGTNLTGATAVKFNGVNASSFMVNSATQITAAVPTSATTGPIAVTTPGGTATSSTNFTVTIPAPTITGFTPASGPVGTSVAISGTNLTGATSVKFNGVSQPTFTVNAGGTQITAAVPAGATTGKITVTTPGGTATSATDFTVTIPAPTITSFTPTSGPVGTSVTINGTNLTGATAVTFNGTAASSFTVVSATKVTATVPAGATTGKIAVTTPGGTATSAANFTVTVAAPPIYLSSTGAGNAGGKAFTGADVLSYAQSTNTWDVLYDGSYIKTAKNVGAFAFAGNDILLGFSAAQAITGLGTAAAQDLVRFTPTSLGYNATAGTFAWFFDGSDVGLTTSAEVIDALWIDAAGRLYLSTTGTAKVTGPGGAVITAHDEDVLRFTPSSTGATTAGTWALYWDPTAMTGMSAEDINGYWEDPATGHRYVTILGAFTVGNPAYGGKFTGNGKTILRFVPNAAAPGGWAPAEKVTWLAAGATFPSNLDGIEMAR